MIQLRGENRLVERYKAGDASAFESIMEHYEPYVLGLARRMTGDSTAAEDICQEVFLKVLRGLRRFKGGSSLKTWIFRISHNAIVDFIRSNKAVTLSLEETDVAGAVSGIDDTSPFISMAESQLREAVVKALMILRPVPREILHLYYWNQLSVSEIGKAMRLPEGTVKTHLFRARKALRESLALPAGEKP